jgi:hypothetical protein
MPSDVAMTLPPSASAFERKAYLVAAGAVLLQALLLSLFPCRSDDIFMHLAVGRRFFAEGGFPETDPFLFSIHGLFSGFT